MIQTKQSLRKKCSKMNAQIEEIQIQMEKRLPRKRFLHTQGVAYIATCLAMRYGEDVEKAMLAGLLHDNAKYIGDELTISECEKYQIEITPIERESVYLLHGKLGAYYAKETYGVVDEDVLNAIRFHTTGRPKMTFLEKAIFVADYIEPRRIQPTQPSLDVIRNTAFENLDLAVYYELENTLSYLKSKNASIDPASITTYDYYKKLLKL